MARPLMLLSDVGLASYSEKRLQGEAELLWWIDPLRMYEIEQVLVSSRAMVNHWALDSSRWDMASPKGTEDSLHLEGTRKSALISL